MITVGIPVLNRYDLLPKAIESAMNGTLKPDEILIVDNGNRINEMQWTPPPNMVVTIYRPGFNTGVASAWNYIITHTKEHRVLINDDLQFLPDSLEKLIHAMEEGAEWACICRPYGMVNGFSCQVISDACIQKVGLFDELISPNYAYHEDDDFAYRMRLAGIEGVDCGAEAIHATSSTLKAFSPQEQMEHHKKFALAQSNYIKKWGGMPLQEKFTVPYGG